MATDESARSQASEAKGWITLRRWRLFVILALAAGVILTEGGLIYYGAFFDPPSPGIEAQFRDGGFYVTRVRDKETAASGIRVKDEIISAWQDRGREIVLRGRFDQGRAMRALQPGTPLHVRVCRKGADGKMHELAVVLPPMKAHPTNVLSRLSSMAGSILLVLACLTAALLIGLTRPGDEGAFVASLLFLSWCSLNWGGGQFLFPPPFRDLSLLLWFGLEASVTAILLWFCLRFPSPSPLDERLPWLKRMGVAFGLIFATWNGILWYIQETDQDIYAQYLDGVRVYDWVLDIVYFLIAVLAVLTLLIKAAQSRSPDERRRLVIILCGILGLFPWLLGFLHQVTVGGPRPMWWNILIAVAELFFPVCFIYAVLKHRVFGIRVFLRRGLQFALLSKGFLTLEGVAIFIGLYYAAGPSIGHIAGEDGGGVMAVAIAGLTVAAVLGIRKVNGKVLLPIERRFFREAYDTRQVLSSLTVDLRRLVGDPDALANAAVEAVSGTLHPENTAVFLRADALAGLPFSRESRPLVRRAVENVRGDSFLSFWRKGPASRGEGGGSGEATLPLFLSGASVAVEMFSGGATAPGSVSLDPKDRQSGAQLLAARALPDERALLEDGLRARLLVPLSVGHDVLGFLVLGEKLSEEPYSGEDEALLFALAQQMADTLDHARLLHQSEEQAQLKREVEIAQQVQENLLPRNPVPVAGLDYSAACKPARYVGGDYYDFIRRGESKVGLALGDISGKGVSAALLMASLQATLREQAEANGGDLAALMAGVNRRLCESASEGRFATLFYGVIDAGARVIEYTNAGHNPPMLFRGTSAGDIIRLDPTGPMIGFFPEQSYGQRRVQLKAGDVLVIFSDGVTEAMNEAGEFFEEDRLVALATSLLDLPSDQIRDRILQEVADFTGQAPQTDDITLLIVRVG